MIKVYIAVSTCLATRGIFLDLMRTLSTEGVLQTLRGLAAERGMSQEIYSDNALGFCNVQKQFRHLFNDHQLQAFITKENLQWHFETLCSPWKDGHFERLVGLVKSALSSSIRKKKMLEASFFHSAQRNTANSELLTAHPPRR